jgi:hypothetical protein
MKGFTDFMSSQFQLSELEYDDFSVYGTKFCRTSEGICLSEELNITELCAFPLSATRRRMHNEPVTRSERRFYISAVGSILFIGHVTSPIAARVAGVLASELPDLTVNNIKEMNENIRKLKYALPAICELFYSSQSSSVERLVWLTFTDVSLSEDASEDRAGVLVTRSFGLKEQGSIHVIDFCSHMLRRVARSTKAAETSAASEGYDRVYYCWEISRWMGKGLH